ncbi:hypothetical protein JTB14_025554 [Gonioctena quinquepunctata]|nr:hypothetical protein JTB14_025554 [Gonioctena quinquepunctata]
MCFVCLESSAPVVNFKEETLEKCRYSLAVRVTSELKDKDKTLPREITDDSIGYHSTCYRSFNAIGKKYKELHEKAKASTGNEGTDENTPEPEAEVQSPGCSFKQIPLPAISDNEDRNILYESVGRSELCPSNVHLRDDLHTGVAFDNFDSFVETIGGKIRSTARVPADDTGRSRKRRRTFDTIIPDIQPFSKRLKSIGGLLPVDFSSRSDIPSNLEEIKIIDAAWLISHVKI